jgi:hypothetical protein
VKFQMPARAIHTGGSADRPRARLRQERKPPRRAPTGPRALARDQGLSIGLFGLVTDHFVQPVPPPMASRAQATTLISKDALEAVVFCISCSGTAIFFIFVTCVCVNYALQGIPPRPTSRCALRASLPCDIAALVRHNSRA